MTRADPVPALVITGVSSEVGTAALTLAVLAEFRAGGPAVEAFRVGPDFIDPGFNDLATGRLSHTVDGRLGGQPHVLDTVAREGLETDLTAIVVYARRCQ